MYPRKSYCTLLARDQQTTKVSRFRQKLLDGANEIPDDQVFTSAPERVQLVKLEFCPHDAEEEEKMLSAARRNNLAALVHFLRCPRDPNITGEDCETPLHCAAESGHGEPVRLLLEAGAEVDRRGEMTVTPLLWAAEYGNSEAVALLLKAGANKDEPEDDDGATPVHTAAYHGHLDVVQMLLEAGAKIDQPANDGTTPLFDAVLGGHLHIARLLVEAGARKDAVAEHDGSTPLCRAAELDRLGIVQFLLESGADKDQASHDGLTPLHFAAKKGHFNMVKCLVESGADSDLRMFNGATALDLATEYGHANVVQFLSEVRATLLPSKVRKTRWETTTGRTAERFALSTPGPMKIIRDVCFLNHCLLRALHWRNHETTKPYKFCCRVWLSHGLCEMHAKYMNQKPIFIIIHSESCGAHPLWSSARNLDQWPWLVATGP